MNKQVITAERRKVLAKRSTQRTAPAIGDCISSSLCDEAPQSSIAPVQIFYNLLHFSLKLLSKLVVGQLIFAVFDFFVLKLQKILEFCVPQDSKEVEGSSQVSQKNDRPIGWLFFIPFLIVLRTLRFYLSVVGVLIGRGEVTAKEMELAVVNFRSYYRSVAHYGVLSYTKAGLEVRNRRCEKYGLWRAIYNVYESIIMTHPPAEDHSDCCVPVTPAVDQTGKHVKSANGTPVKKSSLNEIDDGTTEEEVMTTEHMLNTFAALKDCLNDDPDFVPDSEEPTDDEITSDADSEEEKTESQKQAYAENLDISANASFSGFSSDLDKNDTSKTEGALPLDKDQLVELENQLVLKIMKHFKDNFNYTPTSPEDEFYSPIGSPPDTSYSSDPEVQADENDHKFSNIPQIKSSPVQEVPSSTIAAGKELLDDEVA